MGNWHISIEGVGPHHNDGCTFDADKVARDTVRALRKAGHRITHASFTYGGADMVLEGQPIESLSPIQDMSDKS